jgi:hypothetical protein
MKNTFEVCKVPSSGVPVYVQRAEGLEKAIRTAFALAVREPGHYTVCAGPNASEPILDLDYLDAVEIEEEACQKTTVN